MKIKTFFVSYILFLSILLSAFAIISVYLTNHQMDSLKEQSVREYERIVEIIVREMDTVYSRVQEERVVAYRLESHVDFHYSRGILLDIAPFTGLSDNVQYWFESPEGSYFIRVSRSVSTVPKYFDLYISFNVSENIFELREIQRILIYLFVGFSLFAAIILYIIVNWIFRPLDVVTKTAQKIAEGHYEERIDIKGKDEVATMAAQFNKMADEVESQIKQLKGEADRKQQFMDNLAHEIRTPLTAIYGFAEQIQKTALDEEEKYVATNYLMDESRHMRSLADSMLELAKLRNSQFENKEISVSSLFEQVATTLKMPFEMARVQLEVYSADEIVIGVEELLKSLLINLCINGAKACEPDSGKVVVSVVKEEKHLVIQVADNGCGIPFDETEKILEPFYQVDKVRGESSEGVGLGLAICKEIMNIHDGILEIESELGKGTIIKLYFTS